MLDFGFNLHFVKQALLLLNCFGLTKFQSVSPLYSYFNGKSLFSMRDRDKITQKNILV